MTFEDEVRSSAERKHPDDSVLGGCRKSLPIRRKLHADDVFGVWKQSIVPVERVPDPRTAIARGRGQILTVGRECQAGHERLVAMQRSAGARRDVPQSDDPVSTCRGKELTVR